MTKELNIQTIQQAQAGNPQSLSVVAEQVRQKVYTYIYRLTLDYHLTQDLTQETVLEMIKSIPTLMPERRIIFLFTSRYSIANQPSKVFSSFTIIPNNYFDNSTRFTQFNITIFADRNQ